MNLDPPTILPGLDGTPSGPLHVRPGPDPHSLLLTLNHRQSIHYHNATIAQTFFAPSFLTLTTPLTYDPISKLYLVVINNQKLLAWDGKEVKLDKIPGIDLGIDVLDVIQTHSGCYVAFKNGHVQPISYLRSVDFNKAELCDSPGLFKGHAKPQRTNVIEVKRQTFVVHETDSKILVFRSKINADTGKIDLTPISEVNGRKNSKTLGVLDTHNGPQVFFLDAENILTSTSIFNPAEDDQKLLQLPSTLTKVHLTPIDRDFTFIHGENTESTLVHVLHLASASIFASQILPSTSIDVSTCVDHRLFFKLDSKPAEMAARRLPRRLADMVGKGRRQPNCLERRTVEKDTDGRIQYLGQVTRAVQLYEEIPALLEKKGRPVGTELEKLLGEEEDIPELIVLAMIEFLLSAPDSRLVEKGHEIGQVVRERLLVKAFLKPITETLMLQYLRQTDLDMATKLLEFLDIALKLQNGEHTEEFLQFVLWVTLILNAHYSQMIVTKDAKVLDVIKSITDTVVELENNSNLCATMMPLVSMIREKKCQTPSYANKAYCIEIVNL